MWLLLFFQRQLERLSQQLLLLLYPVHRHLVRIRTFLYIALRACELYTHHLFFQLLLCADGKFTCIITRLWDTPDSTWSTHICVLFFRSQTVRSLQSQSLSKSMIQTLTNWCFQLQSKILRGTHTLSTTNIARKWKENAVVFPGTGTISILHRHIDFTVLYLHTDWHSFSYPKHRYNLPSCNSMHELDLLTNTPRFVG